MPTEVAAVYEADEGILRLERRLDLPDLKRVRIIVKPIPQEESLALSLAGRIVIGEDAARHIVENEELLECD